MREEWENSASLSNVPVHRWLFDISPFYEQPFFISGILLVPWHNLKMIGKIIQLGSQLFSTAILILRVI